jgi:hypothetical protein
MPRKNPEKKSPEFVCEICVYNTSNKKDYNKHLITAKHKNNTTFNDLEQNEDKSPKKSHFIPAKIMCELCRYNTNSKKDYKKHLLTDKHVNKTKILEEEEEDEEEEEVSNQKDKKYTCNKCNKIYNKKNSLWYHEKKCIESVSIDASSNEYKVMSSLMLEIVKSNNYLQKQVLELCKNNNSNNNSNNNNNNNNVINSNNKTFNLNFFLNEECKDAMNLSDFINSIQLNLSDLENIGKVGYVEGISNIIIKELNDTQINKRPVHCSDAKRETLYVKEENKWEKETEDTKKLVRAVRDVNKKNYQLLANWKDIHPNCADSNSKQSNEFTNIVGEVVMDNDETNVKKVIKNVAKQVVIDK